jgi:magnesium transporter
MAKFIKNRSKKTGNAPGSLVFIGNKKIEKPQISVINYSKDFFEEKQVENINESFENAQPDKVSWINVYGLHDIDLLTDLSKQFNLHPLVQEDILNTDQRPKFEADEENITYYLKMIFYDVETKSIGIEQVSIIQGTHYIITLQERLAKVFEPLRERIRNKSGRIRELGPDYLSYAIIDILIDNYLEVIEKIGNDIEIIGNKVLTNPTNKDIEDIYKLKIELNYFRKAVRPVREMISQMIIADTKHITNKTIKYLKDLNDLALQVNETTELYSNLITDHLNLYNANISNRGNEIMKVLTVFAAIFIPLTFLAGVYGTNFKYLPELDFKYSYLIFWVISISLGGGLFIYFKRKGWF